MEVLSQILNNNCQKIKESKGWSSPSKIIGEAVEDCIITLPCQICNEVSLSKCKVNEKSKDVKCEKCLAQFQIKATKHKSSNSSSLKLLGAEYNTTLSSIKENNIHYLILLYSVSDNKYVINDVIFIDKENINESCIKPRKPLSANAKRAGWQGCNLEFNNYKSIKTSPKENEVINKEENKN